MKLYRYCIGWIRKAILTPILSISVLYWVALITFGIGNKEAHCIFLLAYLPGKSWGLHFYWRQKICKPKHTIIREHKTMKNYSHKVCFVYIDQLLHNQLHYRQCGTSRYLWKWKVPLVYIKRWSKKADAATQHSENVLQCYSVASIARWRVNVVEMSRAKPSFQRYN